MGRYPIRQYRGFDVDLPKIPEAPRERLNTFFRIVSEDPDDNSVLEVCGHREDGKLTYPLGDGWVVYWGVVREPAYVTTLKPARPREIQLYAFALYHEFERVDVREKK